MRQPQLKVLVIIACAFIATALAFLGASVASSAITSDIERQTSSLLDNALPSVQDLTRARTELRQLRDSATELALAPPPRETDALDARWSELDASLAHELGTPFYPGEHELYAREVDPAVVQLRVALNDFQHVADAPPGDAALHAATRRLLDAESQADAAVADLLDLNHNEAFAAAQKIVHNRQEAARVSFYLDIGATILAAIAGALAIWFTWHAAKIMRRKLELESERAEELDLFAQRVAHDLMSPLAAASLSVTRAKLKPDDKDTPRALERAERVLGRSRRMLEGIYAFAQASHAEPSPDCRSPLRVAVREAVSTLQAAEGEACPAIDVEGFEEVQVRMDRGMLDVVLSNLLCNAAKYTVGAPVRHVTLRARRDDGERVRVEVEDTGPGVPEGMRDAIFDAYKRGCRTPQMGLGLGLATVKRLVAAHGGAVGVRNGPSGGAIFWFELPIAGRREGAGVEAAREPRGVPMGAQLRPARR